MDREFVITTAGGTGASLGLGSVVTLNGTCFILCKEDWVCFWEGMSGTKNPYISIFLTPKTFFFQPSHELIHIVLALSHFLLFLECLRYLDTQFFIYGSPPGTESIEQKTLLNCL